MGQAAWLQQGAPQSCTNDPATSKTSKLVLEDSIRSRCFDKLISCQFQLLWAAHNQRGMRHIWRRRSLICDSQPVKQGHYAVNHPFSGFHGHSGYRIFDFTLSPCVHLISRPQASPPPAPKRSLASQEEPLLMWKLSGN